MKALLLTLSALLIASLALAQERHKNTGLFYVGPSVQTGKVSGLKDFYLSDYEYWGSAYGSSRVPAANANGDFSDTGLNLGVTGEFGGAYEYNFSMDYFNQSLNFEVGGNYNLTSLVGIEKFKLLVGPSLFFSGYRQKVGSLSVSNSPSILTSDGYFSSGDEVFIESSATGLMGKVTARMDINESMVLSVDYGVPFGINSKANLKIGSTELVDSASFLDSPTGNRVDAVGNSEVSYSGLINITVGWKY